jgi:FtsH-binding integral membrane protein
MQMKPSSRIFVLAAIAGSIYGAFLGDQIASGSGVGLGIGAVIGFFIGSPIIAQMALGTAGVFMGMSGIGPVWTEEHDRRAQRIATVLLILVIISGAFGLLFAPVHLHP